MGRATKIIPVTLAPAELRQVKQFIASGGFGSESDVLREGLRVLSHEKRRGRRGSSLYDRALAKAYRASAQLDTRLADEWSTLPEAWPKE